MKTKPKYKWKTFGNMVWIPDDKESKLFAKILDAKYKSINDSYIAEINKDIANAER